ncbi:CocE/NonD family hydrolase [Jiangella asiatica]|uniref:CocE/NonD family hydrolase n=1 Tax=Jiangella asiatica TaxID=2530372 RepID=A0A4R5DF89_9ACTN|nr:CocE/NonD family hydrolase [Jiangella asiatica]TDE10610.1 CocE/NonD family hydrolase [Jiangella asiatica]
MDSHQILASGITSEDRSGIYDVLVRRDVRIPTADPGITLSADLYLPVTPHAVPVLVSVSPYRKDFIPDDEPFLRRWPERGYAVVLAELRGHGSSDGTALPKFHPDETEDVCTVVEWASSQEWSTGDVGMWGISYAGVTTLRAAAAGCPSLKAIMPLMCPIDPERDAFQHDGARTDLHQRARWGSQMIMEQLLPPLNNYTSPDEQGRWRARMQDSSPLVLDLARPAGDPELRERKVDVGAISIPTFCVGGWRDVYADAMVRVYERVRGPKRLMIGPWAHYFPGTALIYGSIDFYTIALRWWDHWLRGIDDGLMSEPPVALYVQGDHPGWRTYESWPPMSTADELTLATGADLTLRAGNAPAHSSPWAIGVYEPDPTVGSLSGLWGIINPGFGAPLDQHSDDVRALSATSEPLPDDVLICGRGEVVVRVADDTIGRPLQRIVIKLADVDPQGRSTFIAAGVVTPNARGESHRVPLRVTFYRVRAGHRLRVVLSDSDFPRLVPLPAPATISVSRLEITVPILWEAPGAELSAGWDADTSRPAIAEFAPPWLITRDPVYDGIEVLIREPGLRSQVGPGHRVEISGEARAAVRRSAPEAAITRGRHTARVVLTTGEEVSIEAVVHCNQASLWAKGEIAINGLIVFSKIWESSLAHSYGS